MAVVSRIVNWVRVVVGALGQLGPQTELGPVATMVLNLVVMVSKLKHIH